MKNTDVIALYNSKQGEVNVCDDLGTRAKEWFGGGGTQTTTEVRDKRWVP